MSNLVPPVTATEISRLAGVTRATVSNWRRRHADFPRPIGGTDARPVFDLNEVQGWLAGHGRDAEESPITELRTFLRAHQDIDEVGGMLAALRPTAAGWVLDRKAARSAPAELSRLIDAVTAADGRRAAIDALAERVLGEDSAGGVYITPEPVATLMTNLVSAGAGQPLTSVFDPACGSGSLLIAAARAGASELYGQDVLGIQVARTALLVEAETGRAPTVHAGDSLHVDAFPGLRADAVLCNPPSAQRDWGSENLNFADSRWDYGLPPRGESELAWVQHAIAHVRPGAVGALLLPPAVATRGSGRRIRGELLRQGALRAVIGLPAGAAQPWQVALQIWVVCNPEPGTPKPESVLFIDAAELARTPGSDGADWPAVEDTVVTSWRAFESGSLDDAAVPGVATAVRLVEVLDETVDLTPARYVRSSLDPGVFADQVDVASERVAAAVAELGAASSALREWAVPSGRSWRTATVADLASNGVLQWFKACAPRSETVTTDDRRRVLTAPDVATGVPASGTYATSAPADVLVVESGDVLIPAVRSSRTGGRSARVAAPEDIGAIRGPHLHLLRPAAGRSVGWFLAGFAAGSDNSSMTRTTTVRFDPGRLRIPLLPLDEQERYGESFRRLYELRAAARRADDEAARAAELMATGLTAGALTPPEGSGPSPVAREAARGPRRRPH